MHIRLGKETLVDLNKIDAICIEFLDQEERKVEVACYIGDVRYEAPYHECIKYSTQGDDLLPFLIENKDKVEEFLKTTLEERSIL